MNFDQLATRDIAIIPDHAALLIIDAQNFSARRDGGEFRDLDDTDVEERYGWFFRHIEAATLPNMARLIQACRSANVEVMYTVIESLTEDGRDRSLDYRITGFHVPRGSWDGKVLDELAPVGDEIVLPKTSSNVFISTNIDYVLRNMAKRQLIMAGFITDQCVSSAVRDACDLGYLVTLATDATATYSAERHNAALGSLTGYCRRATTSELIKELSSSRQDR